MKFLTLCGSLRQRSSNQAMLDAFTRLLPADSEVVPYTALATLPAFNPDQDKAPYPAPVSELRRMVKQADVLVISSPEYAHGIPGSLKNLLDWLVGDPDFHEKRVLLLYADRGSTWAIDSLREILRTMSARILLSVALPLGTNQVTVENLLSRPELAALLRSACDAALETQSRTNS